MTRVAAVRVLESIDPPASGVIWRMGRHTGDWHYFNSADRRTYPKVFCPIEVRDADGATAVGDFLKLVSDSRQHLKPMITYWRYIRDKRH